MRIQCIYEDCTKGADGGRWEVDVPKDEWRTVIESHMECHDENHDKRNKTEMQKIRSLRNFL